MSSESPASSTGDAAAPKPNSATSTAGSTATTTSVPDAATRETTSAPSSNTAVPTSVSSASTPGPDTTIKSSSSPDAPPVPQPQSHPSSATAPSNATVRPPASVTASTVPATGNQPPPPQSHFYYPPPVTSNKQPAQGPYTAAQTKFDSKITKKPTSSTQSQHAAAGKASTQTSPPSKQQAQSMPPPRNMYPPHARPQGAPGSPGKHQFPHPPASPGRSTNFNHYAPGHPRHEGHPPPPHGWHDGHPPFPPPRSFYDAAAAAGFRHPVPPPPPNGPYRFSNPTLRRDAGHSGSHLTPSTTPMADLSSLATPSIGGVMSPYGDRPLLVQDGREGATSPSQIESAHRDDVSTMGCTCKKTKCLKLYCQCFAVKIYCAGNCRCLGCHNTMRYDAERQEAIRIIISRNPSAFDVKFQKHNLPAYAKVLSHKTGCKCRKSACMKKYCECYAGSVKCSAACRCVGCKNMPADGTAPPPLPPAIVPGSRAGAIRPKASKDESDKISKSKRQEPWMMNAAQNLVSERMI